MGQGERRRTGAGKISRAAVFVVIAAVLVGISSVGVTPASAKGVIPAATATTGNFPVSVQSGDGTVRIPTRPERILSLSASATQMLYAMGAGSQVVGVDKYSSYPANAPRTKFTGYESSAEDYLYLRPDLVIFAFETGTLIQQLQALHIPALLLPPATGMAGVDSQLAELGTATGHQAAARQRRIVNRAGPFYRGGGGRQRRAGQDLLHRGRPHLLHGHLENLYRGGIFAVRHAQYRRRRRPWLRLPANIGRVHPEGKPGLRVPGRYRVLPSDGRHFRSTPGVQRP